ncbi:MAG: hypothetical protein KF694_24685 [Mesorhizobium sp.]|nr:hypothetical protein [Mesorhizobium sp.]
MPIRSKAAEVGVVGPEDLDLLGRVFHDTAVPGETDRDREARASRIIAYFIAGVADEEELRTLAKQPLGR